MDQSTSDAPREAAPSESCDVAATLHVCVTCLAGEDRETAPRAGRRLHDALVEAQRSRDDPPGFRIVEAECLSNCNRGCSVALSGPGRWSYVYGDLGQASVDDLLAGALPQGCDRTHPASHLADTGASHVDRKSPRHDHHRFPRSG
jgi:predicted metal-binding protein